MSFFLSEWAAHIVEVGSLLLATSFVLALVRHSLGTGWIRYALGRHDSVGLLCGALVGAVTPVCSCSVGAVYASLVHNGASTRAAAAFLFAAPAINEIVLAAVVLALGWKGALVYLLAGLIAAVITGRFADVMQIQPCATCAEHMVAQAGNAELPAWRRALLDTEVLARRMAMPVFVGAVIAGVLHALAFDPATVLMRVGNAPWAPIAAALIGLPLHVEPALVAGLVVPLAASGMSAGTLISLTMAITVASAPEGAVLRSLIGWRGLGALVLWYLAYTSGIGLVVNAYHV